MAALSAGGLLLYLIALALGGLGTLVVAFRRDAPLEPTPSLILAVALAALTCFGGGGILALRLFTFGDGRSLVAALIFAALGAALFGGLAVSARRSATRSSGLAELVGALASVTIAIEPGKRGAVAPRFTTPPRTLVRHLGVRADVTGRHHRRGHRAARDTGPGSGGSGPAPNQ